MLHGAHCAPPLTLAVTLCVLCLTLSQAQSCLVANDDDNSSNSTVPRTQIIHWSPSASSSLTLQRPLEMGEYELGNSSSSSSGGNHTAAAAAAVSTAQLTIYLGATSPTLCFSIALYRSAPSDEDATAGHGALVRMVASGYVNNEACGLKLSPHVIDQLGYHNITSRTNSAVDEDVRRRGCWLALVDRYTVSLNLTHEGNDSSNSVCHAVQDKTGQTSTSRVQCRVWLVVRAYSEDATAAQDEKAAATQVRLAAVVVSPAAAGLTEACAHNKHGVAGGSNDEKDEEEDVLCARQCNAAPAVLQPAFWNMTSTNGTALCDWAGWARAHAEEHSIVIDDGLAHTATQLGVLSCVFAFTLGLAIHLMLYIY